MNIRFQVLVGLSVLSLSTAPALRADEAGAAISNALTRHVGTIMDGLREVAERQPTVKSFRDEMKPFMTATPGVFGASLIDTNFVIRAVYFKRDFLAVGFDLKKVRELDYFWKLMREKPAPQISEPGHGSLIQPRLVALRYPMMKDGQFSGIVSVMMHTDPFLKAARLDSVKAYKIICLGVLAEEKGELGDDYEDVTIDLPSTTWVIKYRK